MLPFNKRPGRNDDGDVLTKDDLPPVSKRSVPPMRPPAASVGEDEMTNIIPSRALGSAITPAAGRPASVPPPATPRRAVSSVRGPVSSARGAFNVGHEVSDEDAEDEDNGRTVVRGAPKIVKRTGASPSLSAAAVIRSASDSAPASRRDGGQTTSSHTQQGVGLIPGPPRDLLEDSADYRDGSRLPFAHTTHQHFEGPPSQPPPGFSPPSSRPYGPPSSYPGQTQQGNSAYPQNPYAQAPSQVSGPMMPYAHASGSVPGVAPSAPGSVPAHFVTPRAPYAADPPGTSVTSGHHVSGRPATSWAVALLASGLLVGVVAVAALQGSDSVADTTASFVDPSRAPTKGNAQAAALPVSVVPVAAPAPVAPTAPARPVFGSMPAEPAPVAAPAPPPPAPSAVAVAPPVPTTSVITGGVVGGFAPVSVPQAAAPAAREKEPATPRPVAPRAVWKSAPAPKPTVRLAAAEEEAPKRETKPKKQAAAPDDETRKALEALQKAQLESSSSFGN